MKLPYWHVDAFADRPFAGNQAAVMPLDEWLPDEVLQAIGEENNFAETAFVVRDASGAADWELRWFTPACEIRLCGHATLASGHVLLERDGGERVTFRTRRAGLLEVRRLAAGGYELALPAIPGIAPENPFGDVHEVLVFTTIGLLVLHIAGALKHQFIDRGPSADRMWPFRSTRR